MSIHELLNGKLFTYAILTLYALRGGTYLLGQHYGPAAYWACAFGITVAAEFLIPRFP